MASRCPAIPPMLLTRPRSSGGECQTYDMAQTAALMDGCRDTRMFIPDRASCPLRASSRRDSGPAVANVDLSAGAVRRGRKRRAERTADIRIQGNQEREGRALSPYRPP